MASSLETRWTTPKATEAINISLVPWTSSTNTTHTFHPALCYQLFENETIYGYKNLSVDLKFRQDDMSPALKIRYDSKLGESSSSQSKVDNVDEIIREHLPEDTPSDIDESPSSFAPPGESIATYSPDGSPAIYEIFRSNLSDPKCRQLIKNMQILVLFFIEAGNVIDLEDDEWTINRWEVFFLYERLDSSQYSFIGYCTAHKYYYFSFANKPSDFRDDFRARISQFIILPPYQKQRHGRRFYDAIVRYFLANEYTKEITVEDPSEVFEEMRDVADFQRLKALGIISAQNLETTLNGKQKTKDWITQEHAVNKMPQRQFKRVVEMLLLEQVLALEGFRKEEMLERYKLYVKERLFKHNKDILLQLERDERSAKLEETYMNVHDDYLKLLKRCKSPAVKDQLGVRVIAGKRPSSSLSGIGEAGEEEEEEDEELGPPPKKPRTNI